MIAVFLLVTFVNAATVEVSENPIRRIVNLLQNMQASIEKEGEKDAEMHEKYVCYCKNNDKKLAESVESGRAKVPEIEAELEAATSLKSQLDQVLAEQKQARTDAQASIDGATAQRTKEADAFATDSAELKANIEGCSKAVTAISKGMGASFLQSSSALLLRNIISTRTTLSDYDQRTVLAFLSNSESYAPASGEIVGILKQMQEDMEGDLKESTATEDAAIATFEGLVAAKRREIAAATASIEAKTEKAGDTAVAVVNAKNDLADQQEALAEDQKFLADLKSQCGTAASEFDERVQMRAEESLAVSETVKILNDDDSLDLFKQTLASPATALIQMSREADLRKAGLAFLDDVDSGGSRLAAVKLSLLSKSVGFDKVLKMVENLVVTLKAEQKDDDEHKQWCEGEFDEAEDSEKEVKRKIEGLETAIAETEESISGMKDDIKALTQGIIDLDAAVGEATTQRKQENLVFTQTLAQNNAAIQLLGVAKNRLNKFYNPALYKAPVERELTEEERIYVASGGKLTTPAPGGIAGTGVAVFAQIREASNVAPPPPPATAEAYKKRDSAGPVALLDRLTNDLKTETRELEHDEEVAQSDYEGFMADSAEKRALDSKTITEKESQKAASEAVLVQTKKDNKDAKKELLGLHEMIASLHASCDFLVQNYDTRKEARANEVESLQKASATLQGADYSFLQTTEFLRRA